MQPSDEAIERGYIDEDDGGGGAKGGGWNDVVSFYTCLVVDRSFDRCHCPIIITTS